MHRVLYQTSGYTTFLCGLVPPDPIAININSDPGLDSDSAPAPDPSIDLRVSSLRILLFLVARDIVCMRLNNKHLLYMIRMTT